MKSCAETSPTTPRSSFFIKYHGFVKERRRYPTGSGRQRVSPLSGHAVSRAVSNEMSPIQLGVSVKGGVEAAVHAEHKLTTNKIDSKTLVKLDMMNAFSSTRPCFAEKLGPTPEIDQLSSLAYSKPASVIASDHTITSSTGNQTSKLVPAYTRLEDPSRKGTTRTAKSAPFNPCPSREGPYSNVFFGEPAHGPPHVSGRASGPIGGCRDESRTDNPDLDLRHVFDRNNRKTDLI